MTAWAKIAVDLDSNPKIRKAGRNGREVFLFVIRRNAALDLGGRVPAMHVDAWYLADQLMMSESEALSGLSRCVQAGLLREVDGFFVIVGWNDEWAKRPLTEAERKQRQRAKTETSPGESGHVTEVSGQESDSPECHGSEERRVEEIRVEESREHANRPRRKRPSTHIPESWAPTDSEANRAAADAARARGVDLRSELEKFRDYAKGRDWRKVDWDATWRNWTRNARPVQGNGANSALGAALAIAGGSS